MFDIIIKKVSELFNLGDKALPLVQVLVAAMTNKDTGGLAGFIERFKNTGLTRLVESWMNTSAPLSINHAQIEEVLGGKGGLLEAITNKVGIDKGTALLSLAYLLPNLFNKLAPGGKVAAPLSPAISTFAEKGLAILGIVSAATAPASVSTPPPVSKVAELKPSVAEVTPIPVTKSYTTKVESLAAAPDSESSGNFLKYLIWLIPLLIGLFLLKTCSKAPTTVSSSEPSTALTSSTDGKSEAPSVNSAISAAIPGAGESTSAGTNPVASSVAPAENAKKDIATSDKTSSEAPAENNQPTAAVIPLAKIYFGVGKTDLPGDAGQSLASIVEYVKVNKTAKIKISGFHDPTGNQKKNEVLAKNRAKGVYAKLVSAGVPKNIIALEKPQSTTGSGNTEEARRVEVTISN